MYEEMALVAQTVEPRVKDYNLSPPNPRDAGANPVKCKSGVNLYGRWSISLLN